MSLPYCPNCRFPFKSPPTGWICLQSLPNGKLVDPNGGGIDAEATKFFSGDSDEIPYHDEPDLCNAFTPEGTVCCNPKCGVEKEPGLYDTACPNCLQPLPQIRDIDPRTITVTGPSGAGKTHYIVALAEWWKGHLPYYGLTAVPAMADGIHSAFRGFHRRITRKESVLGATPSGKTISFSWQILPSDPAKGNGLLMTLPDVSGERVLKPSFLKANRYYHFTSGVVFLLDGDRIIYDDDPTTIPDDDLRDPVDHYDVATAMVSDFESRLSFEEMAHIPIAVCVNKIDKLRKHDSRWEDLTGKYIPNHSGHFDEGTCAERSLAIREVLWSNPDTTPLITLLEGKFDNVMFFTIATLGSDREEVEFMPVAVEDPFLYLMWHLDLV